MPTHDARSVVNVKSWKYAKLLRNLGNAVEAVCGPRTNRGPLAYILQEEAKACFRAAKIPYASNDEVKQRRGEKIHVGQIRGRERVGTSGWQGLKRGGDTAEVSYHNGEIAMLGRLYGIPTPANMLVQQAVSELANSREPSGSMSEQDLLNRLREIGAGEKRT